MGWIKDAYIFWVPARLQQKTINRARTMAQTSAPSMRSLYEGMVTRRKDGPLKWLGRKLRRAS